VARRRALAARYGAALGGIPHLRLPGVAPWAEPAWHIFPVRVDFEALGTTRSRFMAALRAAGVGTQVHYIPVHLQPFYRRKFGCGAGLCPVAEAAYRQLLTLPLFVSMTDEEVDYVASVVKRQLAGDAA
jgi:dTDP-4-amino-4,6-dideoxygalactose transaminase